MDDDAGFAVALTFRERLLNNALLELYAGDFPRNQNIDLAGVHALEHVTIVAFVAAPQINCKDNDTMTLTIQMWGSLSLITPTIQETRSVIANLTITFVPEFRITNDKLIIQFGDITQDVNVTGWDFTVIGPAFSPAADAFLHSGTFLNLLQTYVRDFANQVDFAMLGIDLSFLGDTILPILRGAIQSRIVGGALILGIDIVKGELMTSGDVTKLHDFARNYDIAAAVNEQVVPILLDEVIQEVKDQVSQAGATLENPEISAQLDAFHFKGSASNYKGTANISFNLVPTLFAYRPGGLIRYLPKDVIIKQRVWPALGFTPADVQVDEDPALWIDVLTVLTGEIDWRLPLAIFAFLSFLTQMDAAEKAEQIANTKENKSVPRVQHFKSILPGGPPVRVEIADFEIDTPGVYIGITFQPQPKPGKLIGVTSIPSNYCSESLTYSVRLPYGVMSDDPKLRIRWTVYDASGAILLNQDDIAAGRDKLTMIPEQIGPGSPQLGVTVRVYRAIGAQITDFFNDSLVLDIRGPLAPGAYVRWYYDTKNPQVQFDDKNQVWTYSGNLLVKRHSNWHRTDCPCANEGKTSRFAYLVEKVDALPFALKDIALHRSELCDYCFYGGPSGERPSL